MSGLETKSSRARVIELPEELEAVFPLVKELRPHVDLADFKHLAMLAHTADGYRIVVIEEGRSPIALMGYRILHDLVHGSHLYIDDLVTSNLARSRGHGAKLLKFAEAEARRLGLTNLRLSTGADNTEGRRFYELEGWDVHALVFKKKVPSH